MANFDDEILVFTFLKDFDCAVQIKYDIIIRQK